MKKFSLMLLGAVAVGPSAYAVPFAYKKVSSLYLRDLPSAGEDTARKKNDEALYVERGVGLFTTTKTGVIYTEGNRLKFATFNADPKRVGDGIKYLIDDRVTSYAIDEHSELLAYVKSGNLWVKDGISPGPGVVVDYSVDLVRVNQGRVFFSQGYRNFVLEFVKSTGTRKKAIVTTLDNVPPHSVLSAN